MIKTNIPWMKPNFYDNECVLEIKANHETNDDYIEKIIGFPTTRFSKYSRSILFTKDLSYVSKYLNTRLHD